MGHSLLWTYAVLVVYLTPHKDPVMVSILNMRASLATQMARVFRNDQLLWKNLRDAFC